MKEARAVYDIEPTVARGFRYDVEIRGLEDILFNRMPDLSINRTERKSQAKVDPVENERATWREKLHIDAAGVVCIPGENIHESLKAGAKYWGAKIPGEGQKTYTNLITSACVVESLSLGVPKDDETIVFPFGRACNGTPSKGKSSGSKVYKIRPMVRPWGGTFRLNVFDARLTPSVLRTVVEYSGTFVGLGDWRPIHGRYSLVSMVEIEPPKVGGAL